MSKNNDYQNKMGDETRALDTIGNDAAAEVTVENFAAGTEEVRTPMEHGGTLITDEAKFGMLPTQAISLDYAIQREHDFATMSQYTRTHRDGFGGDGADSAAYRSQQEMMKNYKTDVHRLPDAVRDYSMLVPLANLAARAYVKANAVSEFGDFNQTTDIAAQLDKSETKALATGMASADLDEGDSIAAASLDMKVARRSLVWSSHQLAGSLRRIAMKKLGEQKADTEAEKAAIQAKIARIGAIVGYVETAGSMVAGGAGFVNSQLPGAPEAVMDGPDLKQGGAGKVEKAGEGIAKAGGIASTIATMGAELYYQGELDVLDAKIATLTAQIGVEQQDAEYRDIMSAREAFDGAQLNYKATVGKYSAAINDRRKRMADAGHKADLAVDKKGGNDARVGDRMEWATVMLELQSFLSTAMDAGQAAKKMTAEVDDLVRGHRKTYWGTLGDVAGRGENRSRQDPKGPDYAVLHQMTALTENWMTSAAQIQAMVDRTIASGVTPTLEKAGYSGDY